MPQSNEPREDLQDAQQWEEEEETPLPSRPNHNCLYGMQCPQCGSYEPFVIEVRMQVVMYDNGSDAYGDGASGDQECGEDSYCRCVECHHDGTVKDFSQETTNPPVQE